VLVQLAIPASYYVARADRDDERFAWRMFSAVRVKKCKVSITEVRRDGRRLPVDLKHAFHSAWAHALERGRKRVIQAALEGRCQQGGVAEALFERRCQDAARRPLPAESARMHCDEGRIVTEPEP
jgi:hypothetical protein